MINFYFDWKKKFQAILEIQTAHYRFFIVEFWPALNFLFDFSILFSVARNLKIADVKLSQLNANSSVLVIVSKDEKEIVMEFQNWSIFSIYLKLLFSWKNFHFIRLKKMLKNLQFKVPTSMKKKKSATFTYLKQIKIKINKIFCAFHLFAFFKFIIEKVFLKVLHHSGILHTHSRTFHSMIR